MGSKPSGGSSFPHPVCRKIYLSFYHIHFTPAYINKAWTLAYPLSFSLYSPVQLLAIWLHACSCSKIACMQLSANLKGTCRQLRFASTCLTLQQSSTVRLSHGRKAPAAAQAFTCSDLKPLGHPSIKTSVLLCLFHPLDTCADSNPQRWLRSAECHVPDAAQRETLSNQETASSKVRSRVPLNQSLGAALLVPPASQPG